MAGSEITMSGKKATPESPIGVFDSGIGGLTVVSALRRLLPNESILYVGDTARVPYGGKSPSTVERYSLEIAAHLLAERCKTLVVACNTASAVALPALERNLSVEITGVIEPGAAAAIEATRNGHIGVIGTRATIKSGAYERALRALRPDARVSARPCPLLVPLIEEGWLESEVTNRVLMEYLQPLVEQGVDTLVLGCTHYPLLKPAITRLLGESIVLVDSAQNCAKAVQRLLRRNNLERTSRALGPLEITLTDQPGSFLQIARDALHLAGGEVQVRSIAPLASVSLPSSP